VRVKLTNVRFTAGETVKRRTALLPLITTAWPAASKLTFLVTAKVFVSVMVPSQAKVKLPPVARAASRPAWSQVIITAAWLDSVRPRVNSREETAPEAEKNDNFIMVPGDALSSNTPLLCLSK
jgi:hypothetical protein